MVGLAGQINTDRLRRDSRAWFMAGILFSVFGLVQLILLSSEFGWRAAAFGVGCVFFGWSAICVSRNLNERILHDDVRSNSSD